MAAVTEPGVGPDVRVDLARIPAARRKATLLLEVIEAQQGAPIADFDVFLKRDPHDVLDRSDRGLRRQARGTDGTLALPELELGRYEVEVRADGLAPRVVRATVQADPLASTLLVELAAAARKIHGRVVDESGRELAGAQVCVLDAEGAVALPFPGYTTTTTTDGEFAFDGIPATAVAVVAEFKGLAPVGTRIASDDTPIVLSLRAGVIVSLELKCAGEGFDGGCSMVVRDDAGIPVIDQLRHGAIVRMFGRGFTMQLVPGVYTVELFANGFHGAPVRFRAAAGETVTVEMVQDA